MNGFKVGEHKGGFDPFTFDITDAIGTRKSPTEDLVVAVWDPTDAGPQPRGKQVQRPGGIFLDTSVTGIWQTVWLEPVPETNIRGVKIDMDFDKMQYKVTVDVNAPDNEVLLHIKAEASTDDETTEIESSAIGQNGSR